LHCGFLIRLLVFLYSCLGPVCFGCPTDAKTEKAASPLPRPANGTEPPTHILAPSQPPGHLHTFAMLCCMTPARVPTYPGENLCTQTALAPGRLLTTGLLGHGHVNVYNTSCRHTVPPLLTG
jgi:hypothetical protein